MMMEMTAAKMGRLMKKLEIFMLILDYSRAFGSRARSSRGAEADCLDASLDGLTRPAMETFLGVTAGPGSARCRPFSTVTSPAGKPSATKRKPPGTGPTFTGRDALGW